jgi:hypothetical protein
MQYSNIISGEVINQNQGEFDLLSQSTRESIMTNSQPETSLVEPKTKLDKKARKCPDCLETLSDNLDLCICSHSDESETESDNSLNTIILNLESSSDESESEVEIHNISQTELINYLNIINNHLRSINEE